MTKPASLALVLLLVCTVTFRAVHVVWGEEGHKIVGWIAYQHLDPMAKAEIDRLLATESTALWDAAYWPDEVARRQPQYRFANQLHYANVPRGEAAYVPERDRPDGGDVVSAIPHYAEILGDRDDERRLEALRFLSHFVGDIHQPLHMGCKEDRGGNDIYVRFYNRRQKLHAVWNTGIIGKTGFAWEDYGGKLNDLIRPDDVVAYTDRMDVLDWAGESYSLAVAEVYADAEGDLGRVYVEQKLPIVEDQLAIGGVRLAALINTLFPDPDVEDKEEASTPHGKKYHVAGCRYLGGEHTMTTLAGGGRDPRALQGVRAAAGIALPTSPQEQTHEENYDNQCDSHLAERVQYPWN